MDKLRIAPCASVSLSVGGGTVLPPTGARLAWGVASRAVSIRALCLIHISTDARRTGITGQEPKLAGCGEGRVGHGGAAILGLPHCTLLHLFGSSEQPCGLGRQGHML